MPLMKRLNPKTNQLFRCGVDVREDGYEDDDETEHANDDGYHECDGADGEDADTDDNDIDALCWPCYMCRYDDSRNYSHECFVAMSMTKLLIPCSPHF